MLASIYAPHTRANVNEARLLDWRPQRRAPCQPDGLSSTAHQTRHDPSATSPSGRAYGPDDHAPACRKVAFAESSVLSVRCGLENADL
jgi:hypothetical protein